MLRYMKKGLFSSALFFALFFLVAGVGLLSCQQKPIPLGDRPGAQIFNGIVRADVRCARCHGDIGQGASALALVKNGKTIPRDLFIKTVLNGRDKMPPFESVLTEKDIVEIITWLEAVAALPK